MNTIIEQRTYIKFCFEISKDPTETRELIILAFENVSLSGITFDWF